MYVRPHKWKGGRERECTRQRGERARAGEREGGSETGREREQERGREKEKERGRERNREGEKERGRETEKERGREREREREREKERGREREKERGREREHLKGFPQRLHRRDIPVFSRRGNGSESSPQQFRGVFIPVVCPIREKKDKSA